MNYWINYVGGRVSINTYYDCNTTGTTVEDVVENILDESEKGLSASLSGPEEETAVRKALSRFLPREAELEYWASQED